MDLLNARQSRWSRRYQAALREHIAQRRGARMDPALVLGRQAVALGLEPLDMAGIHARSMISLAEKEGAWKAVDITRARRFFLETIVPIEETHAAALEAGRLVKTATETLRQRTRESSAASRRLGSGIAKRKVAESALKTSGRELAKLLQESRQLQGRLRVTTRNKLQAQERVRHAVSLRLQNELAQTLLAIHLHLLTLKVSVKTRLKGLHKEVAAYQAFVRESTSTIQRLKNEIDRHYKG
jgi:hypothetical protein